MITMVMWTNKIDVENLKKKLIGNGALQTHDRPELKFFQGFHNK